MKLSLIWAMADDRVIGDGNRLPWRLPADMRWFRRHTLGKPVLMGRKTFESLGSRPLPERRNVVISTREGYHPEGAEVVGSPEAALRLLRDEEEVMVIGGEQIYRALLPRADRLYLTRIHGCFAGDTRFPPFDETQWLEVARRDFEADEENPWPYSFRILERKRGNGR